MGGFIRVSIISAKKMGSSYVMTKMVKSLSLRSKSISSCASSSSIGGLRSVGPISSRSYRKAAAKAEKKVVVPDTDAEPDSQPLGEDVFPTSSIRKPLSEILTELNKRVPDSVIRTRVEDGFSMKYIPWHIVNRIMNIHAPEWSGEVRNITYSADGKSVSVVYRVTLRGTDSEIYRESTGTASVDDKGYGDPVQKAEAMAFRRACARFGLGLHLYHEDLS